MGIGKVKNLAASVEKQNIASLRRQAEERLLAKTTKLHPPRTEEETQRLVHELEVHQIELEMQNAELRQARDDAELLEKYTDLYDFAPVGYFTLDRNGAISAVNLSGAGLLGIERSRLLGRRFGLFVPVNARPFFSEFLGKVFASQGKESCEVMLTRDGNLLHYVQLEAVAFGAGQECRIAVIDISVRRQLETEIQDSREYAENIVETVREPLVVLNSDLKILTANHSFYDTFKVTPEETIGNFIYDLGNRQWDIPKLRVLFEDILPNETVFNGYEVEHDFQGIGRKIILLNARQVFREKIGSRIILLAMEDITERRHAEDALTEKRRELEELNRSLEVRIVQAVDELRQMDQMLILQDRRAAMGEMINNIAHQWRQPLNSLGLLIQIVPLYYDSGEFSREFFKENTGKCMKLIQHMSQTIDDFKNFFRSDKEAVTFGVNQVIARTLSLIEKSFKDQKIGITLHSEGDPMANGYPNEYSQVLLNILMNARDALAGHNVDDALISIHAFTEGGKTVVTITDNAGGIADEIIDRLFDPYFTTKGSDKGTGIGLFMSKTIIEKSMGGRLTVRNSGSGAEFRIEV